MVRLVMGAEQNQSSRNQERIYLQCAKSLQVLPTLWSLMVGTSFYE